jgi:hypothetical protein
MSLPTISVSTVIDTYYTLLEWGIDPDFLAEQSRISIIEFENLIAVFIFQ